MMDTSLSTWFLACFLIQIIRAQNYESFEASNPTWTAPVRYGARRRTSGTTLKWNIVHGPTASSNTGPSTGQGGVGNYAYFETSAPVEKGDQAYLQATKQITTNTAQLGFWYHMYGSTVGSLELKIKTDSTGNSYTLEHTNRRCSNYMKNGVWTRTWTKPGSLQACADECVAQAGANCDYFSYTETGNEAGSCLYSVQGCRSEYWSNGYKLYKPESYVSTGFYLSGNQGNQWSYRTIDLSSHMAGSGIVDLRFIATRGSS